MITMLLFLVCFILIINMALLGYIVRKIKEVDNDSRRQDKIKTDD